MNKIITISRQYGSGGREIGQKLAKHYDIPFYDNEIITRADLLRKHLQELRIRLQTVCFIHLLWV